ncbi:MAG: hypothetical protein AAF721_38375, partial [Myxococcota bacterium]
ELNLASCWVRSGAVGRGTTLAMDIVDAAQIGGAARFEYRALAIAATGLRLDGRLASARRAIDHALERAEAVVDADDLTLPWLRRVAARIALDDNDLLRAEVHLGRAFENPQIREAERGGDPVFEHRRLWLERAELRLRQGHETEALMDLQWVRSYCDLDACEPELLAELELLLDAANSERAAMANRGPRR